MTAEQIAEQIRGYVANYGLHSGWNILGKRCCTMDELDAAIVREVEDRLTRNSTSMIVTTGNGDSAPGVFLPAPL
jgi:hypothetical protein